MNQEIRRLAVVTGASSGIGAATAEALVAAGFSVLIGARRLDRIEALAQRLAPHAKAAHLDVTDEGSVARFCERVEVCSLLVNNAGGALGLTPIADADEDQWRTMYETNVLGVVRMTKALLPALRASGDGQVVTIGSIAAFERYPGGAGYNAAKAAVAAVMDVLRLEHLGEPLRFSEIDPGMVETEFSLVRFGGDTARAAKVYEAMTPLSAKDIAECVVFVATRPPHVDIDRLVVRPRDQARAGLVHRHQPS
jgi:NADP-dependent 3-hydroxy acid dehydrogenase YdfG